MMVTAGFTDLLSSRRFLPLFVTQFLGAFNDNLFKNALVVAVTFNLLAGLPEDRALLVTIAGGLFILPFMLFSALAGQLSDKLKKDSMIRLVKLAEIGVMALAAIGFLLGNVYFLLVVLFLMGAQSAFFGPLKYGILPVHLKTGELLAGNGMIEAATLIAILIGTILGSVLMTDGGAGSIIVSMAVVIVAIAGWLASRAIPVAPAAEPDLKINMNLIGEIWSLMRRSARQRPVFLSILGISWFWLVGAVFLIQLPNIVPQILNGEKSILTFFLAVFSIGTAIGALACNRFLKGEVNGKTVPLSALLMSLFILDFHFALAGLGTPGAVLSLDGFLSSGPGWRLTLDLLAISIFGGLFSVPLYAIMQHESEPEEKSRIIAGNNIYNALFIVAATGAMTLALAQNVSIADMFLGLAAANFLVSLYICKILPHHLVKGGFAWAFKLFFGARVEGLENLNKLGERAVIVVNHVSFLDGLLIGAFLPGKPMFAVNTHMNRKWWARLFLFLVDAFPLDPTNPMAIRSLIKEVRKGRHCVIFPEGRITVTGSLMKVYEGPGLLADKADAEILPVRIDGAQFSLFSRLKGKLPRRLFPRITLTILEPRRLSVDSELRGRNRRRAAGSALYDVMSDMMFETNNRRKTLFESLLDARAVYGGSHQVLEDIERNPLTYDRLVTGAFVLGGAIKADIGDAPHVGVLLPNTAGVVVTFFALQSMGRVPAMLNFTAGPANMLAACKAAEVKTVLTSRRFVEMGRLQPLIEALQGDHKIVYLEDVRETIGKGAMILGLLKAKFARFAYRPAKDAWSKPAVILFTSGSEGTPKGVVLSHENIQANRMQLSARVDFNTTDKVFNALPVFHSFGMTGGMLLPVLSGIRTFMYPSPLHYRIVPELVYDTNATIMFGTDTFLTGYARMANPYDFYSLRYVFAGAEKVKDETRKIWAERFGVRILEGYGATETAPVLATNTAMHFKAGTVGRLLPGIKHRLEPVPGIDEGGRLMVKGPNVMLGYLRDSAPGQLEPPEGGWYDTGDIVDINRDGFVEIKGRAKRFAKIAGEMVSLTSVESAASKVWPGILHAVVSVPDARKGEQLILFTEEKSADRPTFQKYAKEAGLTELMVPRDIRVIEKMPVLGTGKIDYVGVQALAQPNG